MGVRDIEDWLADQRKAWRIVPTCAPAGQRSPFIKEWPGQGQLANIMIVTETNAGSPADRLEQLLGGPQFQGLKAILERLSPGRDQLPSLAAAANNYANLLACLGYRLTIVPQIHVQDCYERLGAAGGIKAVLPYHDIATQTSLPTLVNCDATVTNTPKSAAFFEALFLELKRQLQAQP